MLATGAAAGLIPVERCVALLAGLRDGQLIPRPSFFQLRNLREARARGKPWHLIAHEDVLIFRNPLFPGSPVQHPLARQEPPAARAGSETRRRAA